MASGNIVRGSSTSVMALLLAIGGTSNIMFPGSNAASTIYNVPTQSVIRGSPAEFPWNVTLDGVTIVTVQWVKMPSTQLAVRSGSFIVSSIYTGRVTNPSAETIVLQNVTDADAGNYQCTVTLSDLTTVEDSVDLVVLDPPNLLVNNNADRGTAAPSEVNTDKPNSGAQNGLKIGLALLAVSIIAAVVI